MSQAMNRRDFVRRAAAATAAVAAPTIIPGSALGANGAVAPSNRITVAVIGTGNQGIHDLRSFLGDPRVRVIAVCDVNRESDGYWSNRVGGSEPARRIVDAHYGDQGCAVYEDYRPLLDRPDLDAVEVATPDHWHGLMVVDAARAGKDIYCQKPMSLTVREGQAMVEAVRRHRRVLQVGSQQRSDYNFRRVCELVRNGRIGRLHTVRCGLPGGIPDFSTQGRFKTPEPVPEGFNYDLWLGPAPWAPYSRGRCHVNYRWIFDYSGGQLTDWGGHHPDIAQWGMGTDHTGPTRITNVQAEFASDPLYDTATRYYFECEYESGVRLIISDRERGGVTFEGTEGRLWANRGAHDGEPRSVLTSVIGPDEIRLYESVNHFRNFIDCVISRQDPVAPVEAGHRSISICHLGNIAMLLGRDLQWDPAREAIVGDAEASAMLGRAYREPWTL